MKNRRGNIWIAALATVLLSFSWQVRASHLLGADIEIHSLEKGKFAIRVNVYTDCESLSKTRFSPITVRSKCGNYQRSSGAGPFLDGDITPVCKSQCSPCNDSSCNLGFGMRRWYFADTIDVGNVNCDEFTVGWQQNARTSKITTGAASQSLYVEATFSKSLFKEKNFLAFSSNPIFIVSKGHCVYGTQSAYNLLYDSVSYSFAKPLSGAGSIIPYAAGYSHDNPLKYDGYPDKEGEFNAPKCKGFHLNPQTGEINFRAIEADITPLVIEAAVWQKDTAGVYKKAATIRRDVTLFIVESPENRVPIATGYRDIKVYSMHHCFGKPLTLSVSSFDPDIGDTISMKLDTDLPGGSTTISTDKWPTGTIYWGPDSSAIRNEPYYADFTLADDVCPVPGVFQRRILIYLHKKPANYTLVKIDLGCGDFLYEAKADTNDTAGTIYKWYVGNVLYGSKNTFTLSSKGGTPANPIKLVVNKGCDQVFYDTVKTSHLPQLTADVSTICRGDTIQLKVLNAGHTFRWWSYHGDTFYTNKPVFGIKAISINPKHDVIYVGITDTVQKCVWSRGIKVSVSDCVWPGDADKNFVVDHRDLLGIGLGYGSTGSARPDTSTAWYAHPATNWNGAYYLGNYKHLDFNGNGLINENDTLVISRHYTQKADSVKVLSNTGPPIGFLIAEDTLYAGDTVTAWLQAGTSATPLQHAYGAAFSYMYPKEIIKPGSYSFSWTKNNILQSSAKLRVYRDWGDGYAEGALVRNDRNTVTGTDYLARIDFILKDSMEYTYPPGGAELSFEFSSLGGIDLHGRRVPVRPLNESAIVMKSRKKPDITDTTDTTKSIKALDIGRVKVYPNPVNGQLFVETEQAPIHEVVLYNMVGKEMIRIHPPVGKRISMDTGQLAKGIYVLRVRTAQGTFNTKILIQ